jgi:antitoxin component YwqK of YwqJK toxin-antitoxin module
VEADFTGEITQEVSGGMVTVSFVNGKKHGPTKFTASDGTVLSEIPYRDDEIHGELRQYYKSGKLLSIVSYENGIQNGQFTSFSENGVMQIQTAYKDGNMNGKFTAYDEFGDVVQECNYIDGQKYGRYTMYYPKLQGGGIFELSYYEMGLLEGDRVTFNPTGETMTVTPYRDGRAQEYCNT